MARRQKAVKLSWHEHNGQYCKVVGCVIGRDGGPKKKLWYLGDEEDAAIRKCIDLQQRWKAHRKAGGKVWDELPWYVETCGTDGQGKKGGNQSVTVPTSVSEAVTAYVATLQAQLEGGQITQSHYDSQRHRLNKAVEPIRKLPVSAMTEQQLTKAVLALCKRPEVKRPNGKPHPMSAAYAKAAVNTLRWFVDWCIDREYAKPIKPTLYAKVWRARPVLTLEEQAARLAGEADDADHFTLDELTALYPKASPFLRCLILLGLNCGFGNGECATLKTAEVKGAIIERYRQKTIRFGAGAYARWHLWPETVAALKAQSRPNGDGLALTTDEGRALTENHASGQSWRRLLARCNQPEEGEEQQGGGVEQTSKVRPLSFKYVRKTAAWLCRTHADTETAEMLLSHADKGMIKHYAARDWDGKLAAALKAMRTHLESMFKAAEEADKAKAEEAKAKAA